MKEELLSKFPIPGPYTGIGSRKTPIVVMDYMNSLGGYLARRSYILRSGGADGADSAFESGCSNNDGKKEIYLPWKGFNHSLSNLYEIPDEALKIASTIHPVWNKLKQGAQKLHARNVLQILGKDLNSPSLFVICWTLDGAPVGGTRTAILLAQKYNIPVYNFGFFAEEIGLFKECISLN